MVVYQLIHNLSTQTCQEIDILPFTQAFATKAEAEKKRRDILSSLKALATVNKATINDHFSCKPHEYMKYVGFRIAVVKRKVDKGELIQLLNSIPCGEYHASVQYIRNHDAAVVAVWDDIPSDDPLARQGLSWNPSFNTLKYDTLADVTENDLKDDGGVWPEQVEWDGEKNVKDVKVNIVF